LITGFLFGTVGALITLSPVEMRSGAHINPVVALAFRLTGKLELRANLGYVVAQLSGAVLGLCHPCREARWAGAWHSGPRYQEKVLPFKLSGWRK
jgi:hypothetical protein